MAYNKSYQEFFTCPQCGRTLTLSNILYVWPFENVINACDDCVTPEQFETTERMTVQEYVENGWLSFVIDHRIDDLKAGDY